MASKLKAKGDVGENPAARKSMAEHVTNAAAGFGAQPMLNQGVKANKKTVKDKKEAAKLEVSHCC